MGCMTWVEAHQDCVWKVVLQQNSDPCKTVFPHVFELHFLKRLNASLVSSDSSFQVPTSVNLLIPESVSHPRPFLPCWAPCHWPTKWIVFHSSISSRWCSSIVSTLNRSSPRAKMDCYDIESCSTHHFTVYFSLYIYISQSIQLCLCQAWSSTWPQAKTLTASDNLAALTKVHRQYWAISTGFEVQIQRAILRKLKNAYQWDLSSDIHWLEQ